MKRLGWGMLILICAPIALIILGFIGSEINKAYWDRQVRRMCESEGGITIYETVTLTEEEFLALGGVKGKPLTVPVKGSARADKNPEFPYEMKWKAKEIRRRFPEVWKSEMIIYKKTDNKVLGRYTSFLRRGGDFSTGIAHESSFSCQNIEEFDRDFERKIFNIKGE